ncbi:MAG: hypothetical protein LH605_10485 [Microbacteriaceae bacterium]|nr:hypothetical protein [Microbacteriaceae bacterium]
MRTGSAGLLVYASVVTVGSLLGGWGVNILQLLVIGGGSSLTDAVLAAPRALLTGFYFLVPLAALYGILIAAVLALLPRVALTGFVCGVLVSGLFVLVGVLPGSAMSFVGGREGVQSLAVIDAVGSVAWMLWSGLVAGASIRIAWPRTRAAGKRDAHLDSAA